MANRSIMLNKLEDRIEILNINLKDALSYIKPHSLDFITSNPPYMHANGLTNENEKKKIFVEMKNKHNTMNSSSSQKTYMRMQHKINKLPKANCFLVEVIAKNSQNIPWIISLDSEQISDNRIRRVSIDKFYEIVTNDKNAFKKLCEKLPVVIDDVLTTIHEDIIDNSVFEELKSINPNILKSLYMLSFSKYEGFDSFDI